VYSSPLGKSEFSDASSAGVSGGTFAADDESESGSGDEMDDELDSSGGIDMLLIF